MRWLHKLRISTKIYLLVGFLGVVAGLVGSVGIIAMRTYDSQVDAMTAASTRALLGERINGLVNAVVMDSRGVYMAENKERVEQFGKPLLENLKRMEALLAEWRPLVLPAQMEQFQRAEKRVAEFIAFRTKLVELGRTNGAPAAREWGDNDANRTNRQALNKELQGIAAQNAELISSGSAGLETFYATMLMTVCHERTDSNGGAELRKR
jgi:methyl-accepting chemotaxis protein